MEEKQKEDRKKFIESHQKMQQSKSQLRISEAKIEHSQDDDEERKSNLS